MKKVAVLGNPNTGKSSIFNLLTGLRQKTGNFAGVTVDTKMGQLKYQGQDFQIIDFPGTYSVYPRSNEEKVVFNILKDQAHPQFPDILLVVVDSSNLERNMLLLDQLYDMNLPTVVVLNMGDIMRKKGYSLEVSQLVKHYPQVEVVDVNARVGLGKNRILEALVKKSSGSNQTGQALEANEDLAWQKRDVEQRRNKIRDLVPEILHHDSKNSYRQKADRILLHPIFGYVAFLLCLFLIFQSVFTLAEYPMNWIESFFSWMSGSLSSLLPEGLTTELLCDGIIPGLGGIAVFIPQIALLFLFLGVLEETGYLSRVIFLMDRLVRPLGLNGRSVVPLISSWACAVPGIMATRMISNWKERMITILVAPLMSCSARIPVYTVLIALVIPDKMVFGFLHLQGLVLFALYFLGLLSALLIALVLKWFMKNKDRSFLLLELPHYHMPRWQNVWATVFLKTKGFVLDAGKIILAISIVLWFAATFGPDGHVRQQTVIENNTEVVQPGIEHSFIGIFGKAIEPAIRPLGYDWKVGIALISSFAAREVFVGTLATIYSVEDPEENEATLLEKMHRQTFPDGTPVFTLGSGISLMVFYVYALQCMATVAIVKRETKSWTWAIGQMVGMGLLAYLLAFCTFQFIV